MFILFYLYLFLLKYQSLKTLSNISIFSLKLSSYVSIKMMKEQYNLMLLNTKSIKLMLNMFLSLYVFIKFGFIFVL